jgi:SAM-dependent methyltransferase
VGFNPQPWDEVYRMLEPAQIPWNAGAPDGDLVRLVEAGTLKPGRIADLGAGPGHDAIYLAKAGFDVLAVEISSVALKMAAAAAGLAGAKVEFHCGDALELKLPDASFDAVYDRGFFHFLQDNSRAKYVELVRAALKPGGLLALRVFSEKEPLGVGPRRYTREALEAALAPGFSLLELAEGVFAGPQKPKAYFTLWRKTS